MNLKFWIVASIKLTELKQIQRFESIWNDFWLARALVFSCWKEARIHKKKKRKNIISNKRKRNCNRWRVKLGIPMKRPLSRLCVITRNASALPWSCLRNLFSGSSRRYYHLISAPYQTSSIIRLNTLQQNSSIFHSEFLPIQSNPIQFNLINTNHYRNFQSNPIQFNNS